LASEPAPRSLALDELFLLHFAQYFIMNEMKEILYAASSYRHKTANIHLSSDSPQEIHISQTRE
jgi:hypothetical protein